MYTRNIFSKYTGKSKKTIKFQTEILLQGLFS